MMDHLTMGHLTMGRLMGHPAWATLAGGASPAAGGGAGHTAGQIAHGLITHPVEAGIAAVILFGAGAIRRARRRRGARRREPSSVDSHDWSWGEKVTTLVLAGLAGAIVWIVATVKSAPATVKAAPPKVTRTTIVQPVINHITHVTTHDVTHAAGGIPTLAWVALIVAVVCVLVAFLNRRGR